MRRGLIVGAISLALPAVVAVAAIRFGMSPDTGRLLQLIGGAGLLAAGAFTALYPARAVRQGSDVLRRPRLWGAGFAIAGLAAVLGGITGGEAGAWVGAVLTWTGLAIVAASLLWPRSATAGRQ